MLYLGLLLASLAVDTTVCDLARSPQQYNGQMIRVRGAVAIDFETFALPVSADCAGKALDDIWLEYGRGPKSQPTTWCCGDLRPRDELAIRQDQGFRRFDRLLRAKPPTRNLAATITGRFDFAPGAPHCQGFGHFGLTCARLVIQSVEDVQSLAVR